MPTSYASIGKGQSGGDPNILKLKDVNKIRPLDDVVAEWRQHGISHPEDEEQFAAQVCPGPRTCPLCRKPSDAKGNQRFPISRRYAANVWDYDTNSVKVLVGGPQIFDEFKAVAAVGINPADCDWTITKEGQRRGTKYQVIRHDAAPFTQAIQPDQLHDVAKYEIPASTEAIFGVLEKFGIDYDALEVPNYTYDEALAFKLPYTKFRGMTIEQALGADTDNFLEWLHGTKLDQGQLGDPVFLALQTVLEEQGRAPSLDDSLSDLPRAGIPAPSPAATAPAPTPTDGPTPVPGVQAPEPSPASANMVELIGPDGQHVTVPPTVVDVMLAQGFTHPEPPAPAEPAPTEMVVSIGGQKVTLPAAQAEALIASGQAQPVQVVPDPEPESVKLPEPDEMVDVELLPAGIKVQLPYGQAEAMVDAGQATFEPSLMDARMAANPPQGSGSASTASSPVSASSPGVEAGAGAQDPPAADDDAEKPHACTQCSARYKSKGALTQHINRAHGAQTTPVAPAVPPATNGTDATLSDRVKAKIATNEGLHRDFDRMLALFEEVTGERNFGNMSDEQLLKLEARLDQEAAA